MTINGGRYVIQREFEKKDASRQPFKDRVADHRIA